MTEKDFESLMQKIGAYDSLNDAQIALSAIVTSLTQSLANGEDVVLEGLGTFTVIDTEVPMRITRNIPGYPPHELLTIEQIKQDFRMRYLLMKKVEVDFEKALIQEINGYNSGDTEKRSFSNQT